MRVKLYCKMEYASVTLDTHVHNYACIIIYFHCYMDSTNHYMFSWCLHRIIHYMHSTNGYMYQIIHYNICTV